MPLILYNIALLHYSAAAASDTHLRDPREALAALGEEELRHGVAAAVGQGDRGDAVVCGGGDAERGEGVGHRSDVDVDVDRRLLM